ncbi:MAG: RNA polymerase sigma factor [Planctomycetaceae bacterium]|nr:RNA polymerase sigma factor [Planctomycetaceae bacterium]
MASSARQQAAENLADHEAPVELVNRCLEGDESAWREFVDRYERSVFGLCLRMLGHRQDAEDIAQDSLVRAIRNLHTWDHTRSIMPWLMTITANRCRTAIQRRRKGPTATDFPIEPTGEHPVDTDDIAEEVSLALQCLRDEYRECFILFYQQELGCAEISEIMECPVGTVKTWLHRARHELAEHLSRRGISADRFTPSPVTGEAD